MSNYLREDADKIPLKDLASFCLDKLEAVVSRDQKLEIIKSFGERAYKRGWNSGLRTIEDYSADIQRDD